MNPFMQGMYGAAAPMMAGGGPQGHGMPGPPGLMPFALGALGGVANGNGALQGGASQMLGALLAQRMKQRQMQDSPGALPGQPIG